MRMVIRALKNIKAIIDKVIDVTIIVLLALFTSVVFLAVIARYLFNAPLAWSEELCRYSFVWLTFLGAEVCLRKGSHISIDIITKNFPLRFQQFLETWMRLFIAVILTALLIGGLKVSTVAHAQLSPGLGLPMSYVYFALPAGAALMLLELLMQALGLREASTNSDK